MLRLRILLQSDYLYFILIFSALIISFFRIYAFPYESKYHLNDTYIKGKLINYVKKDYGYSLLIKGKENVKVTYVTDATFDLELGMVLEFEGELTKPLNNTIPNNFNYRKYLANHYIYYIMKAEKINIVSANKSIIFSLKNFLYNHIESYKYSSAYLKTFIIGDKTDLDNEVYEKYQLNGVSHLLAISGMHINLMAVILLVIFKKVKYKDWILICFFIGYTSLTNYSASINRALLFFILMRLNKYYGFKIKPQNILWITVSLLILYNPLVIYDLAFQYSVIVTYGLIITAKYMSKNYFTNLFKVSCFAFLFSMPITLMNYYEINLIGIINNLIIGPMIGLIIYPLSLITLLIKGFDSLLFILIKIMEIVNELLNGLKLMVIIPKVNLLFWFLYYIFLIIYIYSNRKKYLLLALLWLFSFKLNYYLDDNTYVYFLDVGQGDSTLIYNREEVILVDTGGIKDYTVSNGTLRFMKSLGITKIDLMLLTHGDSDHLLDAPNIINKITVEKVMINNNNINDLEAKIIKIANMVDDYTSSFDINFFKENNPDENKSSIITWIKINNYQMLLMGDAPKEREKDLIKDHDFKIDIIKLGHHGSKTSSDYNFLKKINAKEAIISCGRNNLYHHPSGETIDTLQKLNINYYNTAENGTIKYTFGHKNYFVSTYLP